MGRYTYEVTDGYNAFGAGHYYIVGLLDRGKRIDAWTIDAILPGAAFRLQRRLKKLERVYGAVRAS